MAKVYSGGKYFEIDPDSFEYPHEDLIYFVNGRRYKFVLCHTDSSGVLRGYNTHTKCWWNLWPSYVNKDGSVPVGAELIDGVF